MYLVLMLMRILVDEAILVSYYINFARGFFVTDSSVPELQWRSTRRRLDSDTAE